MKKLLLVAMLASTSTLALANAGTGFYVQGNIGTSKLEAKIDGEKLKDNNAGYTVAFGKDTGLVRYQADYTSFGKIKENGSEGERGAIGYDEWATTLKAQSLGVSAIYDFQTMAGLTPYAGMRAGINQLKYDHHNVSISIMNGGLVNINDNESAKKTQVGVGVLAGVQYAFSPTLAMDAGVEYNYLGKIDEFKVNQYGIKIGLRYSF